MCFSFVCVFSTVAIAKLQAQIITRRTSSSLWKHRLVGCVQHDKLRAAFQTGLFPGMSSHVLYLDSLLLPNYFLLQSAKKVTCRLMRLQLQSIWLRKVPNQSTGPRRILVLVSGEDGWRKAQCTRSAQCQRQQPTFKPQTEYQVGVGDRRVGSLKMLSNNFWVLQCFHMKFTGCSKLADRFATIKSNLIKTFFYFLLQKWVKWNTWGLKQRFKVINIAQLLHFSSVFFYRLIIIQ